MEHQRVSTQILKPIALSEIPIEGYDLKRTLPVLLIKRGASYRAAVSKPFVTGVGDTVEDAIHDLCGALVDLFEDLEQNPSKEAVDDEIFGLLQEVLVRTGETP